MLNLLGIVSLLSCSVVQVILVMIIIGIFIPQGFFHDLWNFLIALIIIGAIIIGFVISIMTIFKN